MKIIKLGEPQVIMSNPESKHNYFGWPTVTRLQNGKIAVVASGFRLRHICPFGKTVIAYSDDNGETYTAPVSVIDTVLDDRDGGILPFGEKSVIVTSFNNTVEFQRLRAKSSYDLEYLDTVTPEAEEEAIGATFRISNDYGVTFGEIHKSTITSPHGPVELPDGTLLWVGRTFNPNNSQRIGIDCIQAHRINPDGSMEYVGQIENVMIGDAQPLSCEPHAIVLDDGTILAHIRVQHQEPKVFTIYQSESRDNGKTWTTPVPILPILGGAPPHLFKHSSGMLICTYGHRERPYGVKAMFSEDGGKTWDIDHDIYVNHISSDLGYPSTIEMEDKSLLTVFYARMGEGEPAVIVQQRWRFEKN